MQKGESGSFNFQKLNQLVTDILSNETDPDNSGTVTISDLEIVSSVNKGNCAYARSPSKKHYLS